MEISISQVALVVAVIYGLVVTALLYWTDKKHQKNRRLLYTVQHALRKLLNDESKD